MSREAIAAALARDDLSVGERLVTFSLASFADRDCLARPGTPAAAGRAGLSKSRFLEARNGLVGRGLVVVERPATGRGRACMISLSFATAGPWWEGEINPELFETVLGYTQAQGSARLLVAAMAALADEHGVVEGFTTEELCVAAGITERTYGRVRGPLLAAGELVLRTATGGRGNTNCWEIPNPRTLTAGAGQVRRRVTPPAGARPLIASVPQPGVADQEGGGVADQVVGDGENRVVDTGKGRQDRTLSSENRPDLSGVSGGKGCQDRTLSARNGPALSGVSLEKGGQDRTLSLETPAKTPAKTPAPNARAGKESQNPRTVHPPNPPQGGSGAESTFVEEAYTTERGRRRRRLVTVDLDTVRAGLVAAQPADRDAWEQVRRVLLQEAGESTFEIWLERLELISVDRDGSLVIDTPPDATRSWVPKRFGRLLERCAARVGRAVRFAQEHERLAVELRASDPPPRATGDEADSEAYAATKALTTRPAASPASARAGRASAGRSPGSSSDGPADGSDAWQVARSCGLPCYRSPHTQVYDQQRGVS